MKSCGAFILCCIAFFCFFMSPAYGAEPVIKTTPLATVNIQDARIISQEGNIVRVAFTLTNRIGTQAGVRYGIKLVSQTTKGQSVVDEIAYDESITLAENTPVQKEVTYAAPLTLSGTYTVLVVSKNEAGFPFGTSVAGKISLSAAVKGITLSGCTLENSETPKKIIKIDGTPVLNENSTLYLHCIATNTIASPIRVVPTFEIRRTSSFGPLLENASDENQQVEIPGGTAKTLTFIVPKANVYGTSFVKFLLANQDGTSNPVFFSYTIPGVNGTIQNVALNKSVYRKDDEAQITVVWTATPGDTSLTANLRNKNGGNCALPVKKDLNLSDAPVVILTFTITKDCVEPHGSVPWISVTLL
jgi:hypothetical protein